jgi:hypothetical protein
MSGPDFKCVHNIPLHKRCRLCEYQAQGTSERQPDPTPAHPRLGAILSRSKPLSLLATEMSINAGLDRAEVARAVRAVSEIHALMSADEWTPDTLDAIAEVLTRHGWPCESPLDLDDPELMHEVRCADGSTEMVSTEELVAASGIFDRRMKGARQ